MSARILPLSIPAAAEPTSPWGAVPATAPCLHQPPLPPASLGEARSLRDALAGLIARERSASADFLLALSDFDQRRGWAPLGHRSLFAFLTFELHLSNGAAYLRSSAAALLPRFPAVEAALRDGRLCLSAVGELARVLTHENQSRVLHRFFGCSAREAREVTAELAPRQDPPRREVVTLLPKPAALGRGAWGAPMVSVSGAVGIGIDAETGEVTAAPELPVPHLASATSGNVGTGADERSPPLGAIGVVPLGPATVDFPSAGPLRAHEVGPTHPARAAAPPAEMEPLTADLRRLHVTVSRRLLEKLALARDGLAHALPGATTEQVIEAALDLLLEKQARRKGLVKRPRSASGGAGRGAGGAPVGTNAGVNAGASAGEAAAGEQDAPGVRRAAAPASDVACNDVPTAATAEPPARLLPGAAAARPRHIPAAVRREVWLRDGQRCQHPLDSGGICGATTRLELDHLVPLALGGPSTAANLRVVCAFHNRAAAGVTLGEALVEDQRKRARARRTR